MPKQRAVKFLQILYPETTSFCNVICLSRALILQNSQYYYYEEQRYSLIPTFSIYASVQQPILSLELPAAFRRVGSFSVSCQCQCSIFLNIQKTQLPQSSLPELSPSARPVLSPYTAVAAGDRCNWHNCRELCLTSTRTCQYQRDQYRHDAPEAVQVAAAHVVCLPMTY